MEKFYTLLNDHLFKKIFTEEKYLKVLLLNLFDVKTNNLKLLNPELIISNKNEKVGIVDLLLEIDNDIVILELQNLNEHNFKDRLLYYTSKIISNYGLKEGDNYQNLKSIKVYAIINYSMNSEDICDLIKLKKRNNKIFNNKLELKIFDLTKVDINNKKSKYYEIVNMFKTDDLKKLKQIISKEELKEILITMEKYNQEESEWKKMEDIYNMMMNEKVDFRAVYNDAKAEGIAIGKNEGITQGISQGITQGINQEKNNVVKNMLAEHLDINLISKCTNLSIEEINAIK